MKFDAIKNKSKSYKKLFKDNKEGEEVLADLLNFCGQYKSSHSPNDPYASAFNEGKRRVILRILNFIKMEEKEIQDIISINNNSVSEVSDPFGLYAKK